MERLAVIVVAVVVVVVVGGGRSVCSLIPPVKIIRLCDMVVLGVVGAKVSVAVGPEGNVIGMSQKNQLLAASILSSTPTTTPPPPLTTTTTTTTTHRESAASSGWRYEYPLQ